MRSWNELTACVADVQELIPILRDDDVEAAAEAVDAFAQRQEGHLFHSPSFWKGHFERHEIALSPPDAESKYSRLSQAVIVMVHELTWLVMRPSRASQKNALKAAVAYLEACLVDVNVRGDFAFHESDVVTFGGRRAKLERKPFLMLQFMASRRSATTDDLRPHVWSDYPTESAVKSAISKANDALNKLSYARTLHWKSGTLHWSCE